MNSEKPVAVFSGADGNVFNLLGIARASLRNSSRENKVAEIQEMIKRVTKCGSYDEALNIMGEYVEVEWENDYD